MDPSPEARPLHAWMQVLDRIEHTLAQSLARASDPGVNAAQEDDAARPGPEASLSALDERLSGLSTRLERAERDVDEADALIAAEVRALHDWLEALAVVRQSPGALTEARPVLADGADQAV